MNKLYLDGKILLAEKIAAEYADYVGMGLTSCPSEIVYKIRAKDESAEIIRSARITAFLEINDNKIKKYAFDTRHIDQETERNPRSNLQYWNRTDPFISEGDKNKLDIFARLMSVLNVIKADLGREPEWFDSYARVLYDTTERILRIKQADLDIYAPQLSYLEQLIMARYRLSIEDLVKMSAEDIRTALLKKDEALLKRGEYMKATGGFAKQSDPNIPLQSVSSTPAPIQYIERPQRRSANGMSKTDLNSIFAGSDFGGSGFRHDGEHSVERQITITIRDTVID